LKNIQDRNIPIALNQKLFLEYESVLNRKEILSLIGASKNDISMILDALLVIARESEPYYLWRPNLKDESDNFVLEIAISTSAILITKNLKDFKSGELRFPEFVVMNPKTYCRHYLKE
jgi:predicted nucleic acid-binding protein